MNNLKNKIIIVTGGSGLLGKAIIQCITDHEGTAINADLNVADDLNHGTILCDITSEESIQRVTENILTKYHQIDGLVNCAYPRTEDWGLKFEDIKTDSWKENVDMQMNSLFMFCQKVIVQMKKQKKGSIVNIASVYGAVGPDFGVYAGTEMTMPAAYSAIKGGIINFSRYLASYAGESGVRVNCVSPGGIFDNQPEQFVKQYEQRVPLKRMGTPGDIAPAVCFLLSDESSYITGHNLMVDGGWTAI